MVDQSVQTRSPEGGESAPEPFYRPSAFEVAVGWLHGVYPMEPLPQHVMAPRAAFESVLMPLLATGTCFVSFSGGRDSSAILAVATRLARQHGLPNPVPVTEVYPGLKDTDESEYQQLVIEHLGLSDWVRIPYHGESDMLGEAAQASLRRRGLLCLPSFHVKDRLFSAASGGVLLTGEGGDEVIGARRITPLTLLLRKRRRPNRHLLRACGGAIAPGTVRRAGARMDMRRSGDRHWLRPAVVREHRRLMAADETSDPLRWDLAAWWLRHRRAIRTGLADYAAVAAEHDVKLVHPFLDDGFLAALARAGGAWGYAGRTALMRILFADVLPDEILRRSSKASFDRAYMGAATREFAANWDGSGVDTDMVDPDALRELWLSDHPTTLSALLLHSVWLTGQSRGAESVELA